MKEDEGVMAEMEYRVRQQLEREEAAQKKRRKLDGSTQKLMSSGLNPGALAALMGDSERYGQP